MEGHQQIRCSVKKCRFNDKSSKCSLPDISVNCECDPGQVCDKTDTVCASFKTE